MPETTYGYFPDVPVNFSPVPVRNFTTEIEVAVNALEQRREMGPADGQRMWRATTFAPDGDFVRSLKMRYVLDRFLKGRKGQARAFYYFAPDPEYAFDAALGSVTAQSSIIIPWRVDSTKGGTIYDIRVAGVTKAFTSRALTPRTDSYATLRFQSTAQYVDAGTNARLRETGDFTIAAWVNAFALSPGGLNAICENETLDTSGIAFAIDSLRRPWLRTNQAGASVTVAGNAIPAYGTWAHVAMVKSGTNVTFYVNGVAAGTAAGVTNPIAPASRSFRISSDIGGNTGLNGLLSDVRYYAEALSAGEIANIYAGNATASANLKGWWPLDEGYGNPSDVSGYGNTTALVSSPSWVAGEEEVTFTGGAQTGAVTGILIGRPRVIARSLSDSIQQAYLDNVAHPRAMFSITILELPI